MTMKLLPVRSFASDDEARLYARLDDLLGKALETVDAAVRLRTAPGDTKRSRSHMKKSLETAAAQGMDALVYSANARNGDNNPR